MSVLAVLMDSANEALAAQQWEQALSNYENAFAQLHQCGDARMAAEVLLSIGKAHYHRGDLELAEDSFLASTRIAEACDLRDVLATGLNCLGIVVQFCAGGEAAAPLYARAADLAREIGDMSLEAKINQNLGTVCAISGDAEGALVRYRSALDCYTALAEDRACAWALNNIGMIEVDLERYSEAAASFARATTYAERIGEADLIGLIELNQVELHLKTGDFVAARTFCASAAAIFARLGARARLANVHKFYGILYRETAGDQAEEHFLEAIRLARLCTDRLNEAESESELALLYDQQGRKGEALRCLNRASRLFTELDAKRDLKTVNKRLDRVEAAYIDVVKSWGESIEAKDHYTAGHCERVAAYASLLARAIGLSERELTWFRMGAFLHDVGKIDLSQEILNKRGPLSPSEWELVKQHTIAGATIVSELDFPWDISPMVRSHHERWDGTGYPDGLRGEQIPLAARILCIADVYDALSSARSYKPALARAEALEIMQQDAGIALDPELFAVFRTLLADDEARSSAADDTSFRTILSVA